METPVNPSGMEAVHSGHSAVLSLSTPVIELDTDYPWVSGRIWSSAFSGVGEHTTGEMEGCVTHMYTTLSLISQSW